MADNTTTPVKPEDVTSVGTRVSWGALLAGVVVALAVYVIFTTLAAAVGFSISDKVNLKVLAGGGLVWAILTMALATFCGGWTTSQLTAGETKCESMMYGLILWGTLMAVMMWMTAAGMRSGFNAMLNVAYAGSTASAAEGNWEDAARRAGVSEDTIAKGREAVKDKVAKTEATAREHTPEEIARGVTMMTWGALFSMLLSLGAAIGGAYAGAGPSRVLLWAGHGPLRRTTVTTTERQLASHV